MRSFEFQGVLRKRVAGTALLVLAGLALSGWVLGLPLLTTWGAAPAAISPLAAIGFAIAGVCLLEQHGPQPRLPMVCAGLIGIAGFLDILPTLYRIEFAKPLILARWADQSVASEIVSLGFVLVAIAFAADQRNATLTRLLGGLVALIGVLALLDLAVTLGDRHLPGFTNVALPTAVGFVLLSAGLALNAEDELPEAPLKAVLGGLVILTLLPAFVFMTAQTRRLSEQQIEAVKVTGATAADDMLSMVEVRLGERIALLRGLATSPALAPAAGEGEGEVPSQKQLEVFLAQLHVAIGTSSGWISLTDAAGNQLVNSRRTMNEANVPRVQLRTIAGALAKQRPMVSDLHVSEMQPDLDLISVTYPVPGRKLTLNWRLPAQDFSVGLMRIAPRGWTYTIVDSKGRIIARSRDAEQRTGETASQSTLAKALASDSGWDRSLNLDGTPVYTSWKRSNWGWIALAGIGERDLVNAGRAENRRLTIGATMMTIIGLTFATLGAILISRPLLRFSSLSEADGEGPDRRTGHFSVVREINALARALIGAARDRRLASEALTESETRLRRFVDQAPAAIAMFDRDMRYLAASQRWHAYFALGQGDLVGRLHYDVFPHVNPEWKRFHEQGLAGEVIEVDNAPFVDWAGRTRFIHWEIRPWRAVDGAIGGITIFAEDVTERAVTERALRESEVRQKAIVDTATDAIVVIDHRGLIESVNGAAEKMFGYSSSEAVGKNVGILMADEDRQRHDSYLTAYEETGKAKIIGLGREVIGRRKDGSLLPIDLSIAEWTVDGQNHYTGIMRDITSRKEREAHVRLVMRELSHRTKNALAVVQAMAWQTSQSSETMAEFQQQFGQRVEGLSRSIGLLVKSEWEGVGVRDLVEGQLAPFLDPSTPRLVCAGPDLNLKPNAAQDLGLVLHELATNASKYGALSVADGRVEARWARHDDGGTKRFQFDWRELGGPEVEPPERAGFGSVLIKDLLVRTYGAQIEMTFAREGLSWRFVVEEERIVA